MLKKVEKPKDWNDHLGWEDYYAYLHGSGNHLRECQWTGSISTDRVGEFAEGLKQGQMETIWIPGCGVSLLPRLLQKAGLRSSQPMCHKLRLTFSNTTRVPLMKSSQDQNEV